MNQNQVTFYRLIDRLSKVTKGCSVSKEVPNGLALKRARPDLESRAVALVVHWRLMMTHKTTFLR